MSWHILRCDGLWFLADMIDDREASELYVLNQEIMLIPGQNGIRGAAVDVRSFALHALTGKVPAHINPSIIIAVRDLEPQDARQIMDYVEDARKQAAEIRARKSGLTIETSLPAGLKPHH